MEKQNFILNKIKPTYRWIALSLIFIVGLSLLLFGFHREYTINIDGVDYHFKTIAFSVKTLFKQAGFEPNEADRVSVNLKAFSLNLPQTIHVQRARQVSILLNDKIQQLNTAERYPASLLHLADITLFPNDIILQNGEPVDPYLPLPLGKELILEFLPAKLIHLNDEGKQSYFSTQAECLSEALSEKSISIGPYDRLSSPQSTVLTSQNDIEIHRAREWNITAGDKTITGFSAARTPEEALFDLGVALQNLDEVKELPNADANAQSQVKNLHIVRVREITTLIKDETPFEYSYEFDDNTELDTSRVLVPGQTGYVVSRSLTLVHDDTEAITFPSQEWKASDPIDGVIGRGTRPVVRTKTVDGVTFDYWRKVTVYATSYHPGAFGGDTQTRSGIPLTKGIVAVSAAWYPSMAGQRVFVPNYGHGVIGDSGYGIPGRYWIDLGYDDDNYVGWHYWTTLYFLTPIPAYFPVVLP